MPPSIRAFRRTPGLALTIVLTLALGIGANTAIFTIARAALLAPLPYADADRLVNIAPAPESAPDTRLRASYPELEEWRSLDGILAAAEAYDPTNVTLAPSGARGGSADAMMLQGARVTAGFLSMLGVRPERGRDFRPEEERPGGAPVVIVSHEFWQRELGADPGALGRELDIDARPHTVIGILPRRFHFAQLGRPELWFPLDLGAGTRADPSVRVLTVVARLRDGIAVERAGAELAAHARRIAIERPASNRGLTVVTTPLRDWLVGDVRGLLLLLMGSVALILLIACANIAGLLLSRALARAPEIAIRAALGASRRQLVTQLLGESMVLAFAGGAVGVWLASLGVDVLIAAMPPALVSDMPWLAETTVSGGVIAYTVAITLFAGIAFGLAPALYGSRTNLATLITQGSRTAASRARSRLGDALVVGQIALTFVLLLAAGLTTRSLARLLSTDTGFESANVVTMRVALPVVRYASDTAQRQFFEQLLAEVGAMPGVRAAGAISNLPLSGSGTNAFRVDGRTDDLVAGRPREATTRGVAGDYFATMMIPIVAGRTFATADRADAPPVVIVNQSLARDLFPGRSAIGERIRFDGQPDRAFEIVGIAGDVKAASLGAPATPMIYYSHLQRAENRMSLVVRTEGDASTVIRVVREIVRAVDPALPVYAVTTMEDQIGSSPDVAARRYPLTLIGAFSLAALLLAVLGIHGVIAYAVARRMREFGIRVALGARGVDILRIALGHAANVGAWGIGIGIALAIPLAGAVRPLLFETMAVDPLTWIGVAALLGSVTVLASWIPAQRAARVNPVDSLRAE